VAGTLLASISEAALALEAGLAALWCHRYLTGTLETLDLEMNNATLELANRLGLYLRKN
jgi:hypothetical protein